MPTIAPIRTDLFRFVTIRTPQLIAQNKREFGFIFHPAPEKSYFLKGTDQSTSLQQMRGNVTRLTSTFKAFRTYQQVMAINPDLYRFSSWLMKNRAKSTVDNLKQRVQGAGSLKEQELLTLWDNLFHQTITRTSMHVRQACIQMIVANNFIEVVKKAKLKDLADELIETPRTPLGPDAENRLRLLLKRLAKAKVVLPMAFTVARDSNDTTESTQPGGHDELVKSHENAINVSRTNNLVNVKSELQNLKPVTPNQPAARKAKQSIPISDLKKNPIPKVSKTTDSFIKALPDNDKTVDDIATDLSTNIKKLQSESRAGRKKGRKQIISRGHRISTKPNDLNKYAVSIRDNEFNSFAEKKLPSSAYMSLNAGHKNAYPVSADYSLTAGNKVMKSNQMEVLDNSGDYMHVKLFPDQELNIDDNSTYELKGQVQMDDGTTLSLDTKGHTKNKISNGIAVPVPKVPTASPASTPATSSQVELYGVSNIGIGVLRKVEQEVCCYVPGEVSRIENIMAREYKERHTRSLTSTETTEETTSETEVENLTDTATTNRNEMQTEIAHVLAEDNSQSVGGSLGVSASAFGAEVTADAYIDSSSSTSASTSDSAAKTYAEEVTQRTLERVVQKTTVKRTSRMLQEYEENNRHGFDNRAGDKHVTGVYRWVDIVYTNRLINYGKRLMYEFMLPEPAYFYKQALQAIAEEAGSTTTDTTVLEEPIHPSDHDITGPDTIDADTYLDYARLYDITISAPLEEIDPLTDSFVPITPPDGKDKSYDFDMLIPPGYEAYEVDGKVNCNYHYGGTESGSEFIVIVGGKTYKAPLKTEGSGKKDLHDDFEKKFIPGLVNNISIQVNCKNVHSFSVSITAHVKVQNNVMSTWQDAAYDQIMRAYEDQVAAYEAELQKASEEAEALAEKAEDDVHRAFNRTVEQREIQRLCIEMMTKPFGIRVGKNFYTDGKCVPSINQTSAFEKYAAQAKFFEQVFDWENMSYLFYPYYWAAKCDWTSMLQSEFERDSVFQAFLQCGMARVVVPVRPGFEDTVTYYMETGDIWSGGDLVIETDDDLYLSIAEELQEIEGFVEEEWQSRVPTTLNIVQGESVFLEEEGLPCCEHIENTESTTHLVGSTAVLSGIK